MSQHEWERPGPVALGICALVLSLYPVVGVPVAIAGTWVAVRGVRRRPYDGYAIILLCGNVLVLSIGVAAWIWGVWIAGLYGIAVSPSPN